MQSYWNVCSGRREGGHVGQALECNVYTSGTDGCPRAGGGDINAIAIRTTIYTSMLNKVKYNV